MKISKLGLTLVVINSLIVALGCTVDTMDGLKTSTSGFALIPILIIDFPISLLAYSFSGFINDLLFQGKHYYIISGSVRAVSFIIFGGLQWYSIGWVLIKLKRRFFLPKEERVRF